MGRPTEPLHRKLLTSRHVVDLFCTRAAVLVYRMLCTAEREEGDLTPISTRKVNQAASVFDPVSMVLRCSPKIPLVQQADRLLPVARTGLQPIHP